MATKTSLGFPVIDNAAEDSLLYVRDYLKLITGNGDDSIVSIANAELLKRACKNAKTSAEWEADTETIIAAGEFGYATDTMQFKFGDGVSAWNSLTVADPTYNSFVSCGYEGTMEDFYALLFTVLTGAGNGTNVVVDFEKAEERNNIENGETLSVLFGKLSRMADDTLFVDSVIDCGTFEEGGSD